MIDLKNHNLLKNCILKSKHTLRRRLVDMLKMSIRKKRKSSLNKEIELVSLEKGNISFSKEVQTTTWGDGPFQVLKE